MNKTIGGFTTDRKWILDKLLPEDITYLDDYAKEHSIIRRIRTIGVNDIPNLSKYNRKDYDLFTGILKRVYSHLYLNKAPSYEFVTIERDLHITSNFINHIDTCYREDDWQIDKDLYYTDKWSEKKYCKESILFLPSYLNTLFIDKSAGRGNFPLFITKIPEGGGKGIINNVCIYNQKPFSQRYPYSNYSSKEEALLQALSKAVKIKLSEIERHIGIIKLMYKPPQDWKNKAISGLQNGTQKYNILLEEFTPEDYSKYL